MQIPKGLQILKLISADSKEVADTEFVTADFKGFSGEEQPFRSLGWLPSAALSVGRVSILVGC